MEIDKDFKTPTRFEGIEEEEETDFIYNQGKPEGQGSQYLYCSQCGSARHEILYYIKGYLLVRCLNCGIISQLPLDQKTFKKLQEPKTKRNKKQNHTGTYYG